MKTRKTHCLRRRSVSWKLGKRCQSVWHGQVHVYLYLFQMTTHPSDLFIFLLNNTNEPSRAEPKNPPWAALSGNHSSIHQCPIWTKSRKKIQIQIQIGIEDIIGDSTIYSRSENNAPGVEKRPGADRNGSQVFFGHLACPHENPGQKCALFPSSSSHFPFWPFRPSAWKTNEWKILCPAVWKFVDNENVRVDFRESKKISQRLNEKQHPKNHKRFKRKQHGQ